MQPHSLTEKTEKENEETVPVLQGGKSLAKASKWSTLKRGLNISVNSQA